jgi:hypothetical protein
LLPAASRRRGLAAIGLELDAPGEVQLTAVENGNTIVRCSEQRDGKTVGELEVEVFKAALVIDRDGILEEKAHLAVDAEKGRVTPPVPVSLPGASGYRANVEIIRPGARAALPYVYVFAIAPHDLGVDGGVLVTVRSATPEWPAADAMLRTMRVLGRNSTANDSEPAPTLLPMIGKHDED